MIRISLAKSRSIFLLVAISPFLIGFSWGKYDGHLLDAEDNSPVEGALVVAQWEDCIGFGHCNSFCAHSEIATTDNRGYFSVPARDSDHPGITFYKPGFIVNKVHALFGYVKKPDPEGRKYFIHRFNGNSEERLKYLRSINVDCSSRDSNGSKLPAVYVRILEEVKQHHESQDYKKTLLSVCERLGYASVRHGLMKVHSPTEDQMSEYLRIYRPDCRIAAFTYKDRENFERAVQSNDIGKMQKFFSEGLEMETVYGGQYLLAQAIDRGNYEALKALLEHGANPNGNENRPSSVISDLIKSTLPGSKKSDIFQLLIKHDARLDVRNNNNHTLFESAIFHGDATISKLLMDRGADVSSTDTRNKDGRTLIESAYYGGNAQIVEILIKRGMDVSSFSISQTMTMMRYPALPGTIYPQISFCDLLPEGAKLKDGAKINGRCEDYRQIRSDLASRELKKLIRETKIRGSRHLFRVTVDCDSARLTTIAENLEAYDLEVVKYAYIFEANSKKKEKARIYSDELKSNVKQCIIDQYYKDITFPAGSEEYIVIKINFPVVLAKGMTPKVPPRSN